MMRSVRSGLASVDSFVECGDFVNNRRCRRCKNVVKLQYPVMKVLQVDLRLGVRNVDGGRGEDSPDRLKLQLPRERFTCCTLPASHLDQLNVLGGGSF